MAKTEVVKTKRLVISPMTEQEIIDMIREEADEEMVQAYTEMLELARANRDHWAFCAPWKICLKKSNEMVGDLCFKGPQKAGRVEIGYGTKPEHQKNGYMTEAVGGMVNWAFYQQDVYIVEAETLEDNTASQKVIEKNQFKPTGIIGEEGPRFLVRKAKSAWMAIYMCFGVSIGAALGSAAGKLGLYMPIGIAIGMCIGVALDRHELKRRMEITGETEAEINGKEA